MTQSLARTVGNLGNVLSTSGQYATQATPPALDASSNLATTQFLKNSGKTYSNVYTLAASAALPLSYGGGLCTASVNGLTFTLPALGSCPPGFVITFYNSLATGTFTIKGSTTELIAQVITPAGNNTLTLFPGESVEIISKSTIWLGADFIQLNTPNFTSPTVSAPPAQFDSSTKIPNTTWIQNRGVQFGPTTRSISVTNTFLTAADAGTLLYFNAGSAQAVALPALTAVPTGTTYVLQTSGLNGLTVVSNGSIANIDTGSGIVASTTMVPGESVTVTARGTVWICSGNLPYRLGWIQGQFNYTNGTVTTEASSRAAADSTLQTNINNEANTRASVDASLNSSINSEITNRVNGDNNLQNQINGISTVYGIRSYYFVQQSQWSGGWGPGGSGTLSGIPGNWLLTTTTQVAGDNVGLAFRYA